MNEYVGHLHIHTTYSDGSGTIKEVVEAGKKAGLDFLGITDHHTLQGLYDGKEGWYDNILVLIGSELNSEKNHYLAFGISENIPNYCKEPQKSIDEVNSQGGIGFIAHPFEKGSKLVYNGREYRWTDWEVSGFNGIEIWNYCSQWKANLNSILLAIYRIYIDRSGHVNPCFETLNKWDEITINRKAVAIGGSDAHAVKIKTSLFKTVIFPYEFLFKTVNTHIISKKPLTGEFKIDKKIIYDCLKNGNCFIGYDEFYDSKGFRFTGKTKENSAIMGDDLTLGFDEEALILISSPKKGLIRLYYNGKLIKEEKGYSLNYKTNKPGVYRATVDHKKKIYGYRPWILSNPIYINQGGK